MGQKSLYSLHKIDTSMFWESSIQNTKYRWLSYNLWFTFLYYYKLTSFSIKEVDVVFNNLTRIGDRLIYNEFFKHKDFSYTSIRFSYHIELYCFEFLNSLVLINIFFLTDLSFFKLKAKNKKRDLKKIKNWFV